jgi:hypothetical protein
MGRDPQLWRGHRIHPIPESYSSFTILHSRAVAYLESNLPVDGEPVRPSRKRRIRQEARCGCAGIRDSGGGPSPNAMQRATRRHQFCIPVQHPRERAIPGRFHDSALKCSMAAPAAARRLREHPSNDTPIALARGWKCATDGGTPGKPSKSLTQSQRLTDLPGGLQDERNLVLRFD